MAVRLYVYAGFLGFVLAVGNLCLVESVRFKLDPREKRCLTEDIGSSQMMVLLFGAKRPSGVDLQVTLHNPAQGVIFKKTNPTEGKYEFTTKDAGVYRVCAEYVVPSGKRSRIEGEMKVKLEIVSFAQYNPLENVPNEWDLETIEREIAIMESMLYEIEENLKELKESQTEGYAHSEYLNSKPIWMGATSAVFILLIGAYQTYYTKTLLQKHKAI